MGVPFVFPYGRDHEVRPAGLVVAAIQEGFSRMLT